jgi:hypothetical protein
VTPLDPMEAWRAFRPNSIIWARWWLENGRELPASCHHVIADRLAPWIDAVTESGPDTRAALLVVVPPIPHREPEPTRAWVMPAIGKTYSMESEEEEQGVSEVADEPEKPISDGRGGVTREKDDVRHPPSMRYLSGRRYRVPSS